MTSVVLVREIWAHLQSEPNFFRQSGPSSTLELPMGRDGELAHSWPDKPPCVGVHPTEQVGRLSMPSGERQVSHCCFGLTAVQKAGALDREPSPHL